MTTQEIIDEITVSFNKYLPTPGSGVFNPIPKSVTSGKLYEAFILALVAKNLTDREGFNLQLSTGTNIYLRSSPGPIDRKFPFIKILDPVTGQMIAEIWTDIEFLTLSYDHRRSYNSTPRRGDYHELDILVIDPGQNGRPSYRTIWLGIECKNTPYKKQLLKEILGIRREMSLLVDSQRTKFKSWPRSHVPADPPSCLLVYSSSWEITEYDTPGETFGIDFNHEPI